MYQELGLSDDEVLVCLFLRGVGEAQDQLAVTDFERRPAIHEGGLSFFRREHCTYRQLVDRVARKPNHRRGIAKATVGELRALGFRVFGDLEADNAHVNLHCCDCNGAESDCTTHSEFCPFLRPAGLSAGQDSHILRSQLARTLTILFEATTTKQELLAIFGKDVDETDAREANDQYEKRLDEYRTRQIKLS